MSDASLDALLGDVGGVVLAPHPDDETLGCGALLAAGWAAGRRMHVVVVTGGERSHRRSASWPPARLARLRRSEAIEAVRRLGGGEEDVSFLGFPDWGAPSDGVGLDCAAVVVAARMERLGARALFSTSPEDAHADHRATARIAAKVAGSRPGTRLFHYPVWRGADVGRSRLARAMRFPVAPYAARKRHALCAHRSQLGQVVRDDPEGFVLRPEFFEPFLTGHEVYMEAVHAVRDR